MQLDYSLTNHRSAPVFVFDSKASSQMPITDAQPFGTPDLDWMYVEMVPDGLVSKRAMLRRVLDRNGPLGEHPSMPFARRVGAGETISRSVRLSLPLKEHAAHKAAKIDWSRGGTQFHSARVSTADLSIGWSPALPPEPWGPFIQRFSLGGEELLFLDPSMNGWLNERQQIATSPSVPVDCEGLVYVTQ